MAKAKSKPKTRARRNRALSDPPEALIELIERERGRLMQACSVLHCAAYTLIHEHGQDGREGCYADSVKVAERLVADAIDALDRVNLPALRG